jgi:hypothetical protein
VVSFSVHWVWWLVVRCVEWVVSINAYRAFIRPRAERSVNAERRALHAEQAPAQMEDAVEAAAIGVVSLENKRRESLIPKSPITAIGGSDGESASPSRVNSMSGVPHMTSKREQTAPTVVVRLHTTLVLPRVGQPTICTMKVSFFCAGGSAPADPRRVFIASAAFSVTAFLAVEGFFIAFMVFIAFMASFIAAAIAFKDC